MAKQVKPVAFLGSALDDLRAFPSAARRQAGFQLDHVQNGREPDDWKPMNSIGAGVREIRRRGFRFALLPEEVAADQRRGHCPGRETLQGFAERPEVMKSKRFESVWDAIEDTAADAENMKLRSKLMMAMRDYIEREGLSQAQAAKLLGVTQPRISDLVRGKIDLFSIDTLVNMLGAAGLHVDFKIGKAA